MGAFDHLVEEAVLDSVECFIVGGHALSSKTFEEIKTRVERGATYIIAKRLYSQYTEKQLPVKWLVVKSFQDPSIVKALTPFLDPPDVVRFRVAHHIFDFTRLEPSISICL